MPDALFADISMIQTVNDMAAYANWSAQGDGIARLACKITEGVGYKDAKVEGFAAEALAVNVGMMAFYHYARPDLNPGAIGAANEARWFASQIGARLRAQDRLMLDFEQNEDASWARAFHDALMAALPRTVKPVLYDSLSHFNQFFASDMTLAGMYDAALAAWYPLANGPPAAPAGWKVAWWQFTDNSGNRPIVPVPGVSMPVDLNLWLGGGTMVLPGPFVWLTLGKEIPSGTTFEQLATTYGLYWTSDLLPLNPWAQGYNPTLPIADGTLVKLPGYPQQPSGTAKLVIDATSIRAVIV